MNNPSRRAGKWLTWLTLLAAAGCGPAEGPTADPDAARGESLAESYKDFGEYVVHFSALATDQLAPEVARVYDIVRSKNRAMLSIAVLRKVEGTLGKSVTGDISARATNLTGQLKNVRLRPITEGDAIYYIAEIPVANGETLIFDVDVTPEGETSRFSFRFKQTFFTT